RSPACRRTSSAKSRSARRCAAPASRRTRPPRSSWARSLPPAKARTRRGRRRTAPVCRSRSPPMAATSRAAPGRPTWRPAIRLRSVALGYQAIQTGDAAIVVAGGQESMSQAPHCIHLRNGVKMGDAELVDTMIRDGLWDAFNGYHMGNTAENVAQRWQITREEQDGFAAAAQAKAEAAQKAGRFKDEIVPVKIATRRGETVVDTDEHPKHGTTVEVLSKLRPAFDKNGTVTAGNASGINDGAAAV